MVSNLYHQIILTSDSSLFFVVLKTSECITRLLSAETRHSEGGLRLGIVYCYISHTLIVLLIASILYIEVRWY